MLLQQSLILEAIHLDLERTAALDHLILTGRSEAPKREITTRACA
jgi:hypothetical protein